MIKNPSQLLQEKCETFVTSSTHDDGTYKKAKDYFKY